MALPQLEQPRSSSSEPTFTSSTPSPPQAAINNDSSDDSDDAYSTSAAIATTTTFATQKINSAKPMSSSTSSTYTVPLTTRTPSIERQPSNRGPRLSSLQQQQQQLVSSKSLTTHNAANTFKSFTRSLSHYFSSSASTSLEDRTSTPENDSPSSDASGTVEDVVRVHLKSRSGQEPQSEEELEEYFLLVYKRVQRNDPASMVQLENALVEGDIDDLTTFIVENKESTQEKRSMALGKHYRCFYYDNAMLNIKSTLMDQRKDTFTVNNGMLLQLLYDIKNDFEAIPNTSEVYTRSTTNHWIAGRRVYNRLAVRQQQVQASNTDDHQDPPTEDEEEEGHYDEGVMSDYVEMYLLEAKKDTSLADVEETMHKMAASVVGNMRIE